MFFAAIAERLGSLVRTVVETIKVCGVSKERGGSDRSVRHVEHVWMDVELRVWVEGLRAWQR